MRNLTRMMSYVAAAVLVSAGAVARAEDEKLPLDKLPKAVVEAVKAKFPQAEMKAAAKEVEDGKTSYEVTIMVGDAKMDVDVTGAGVITGYEKTVKFADLPKPVSKTVSEKYPQAKPETAEAVYKVADGKDTIAYYEVMVTVGDKKMELEILADGKMKPGEKEEKEEKDEKKEDKDDKKEDKKDKND